ncbi:prepilin-type N-terminal cleavage/methylation domain-containing protein [Kineosporia sp. J2-2]|uniref:Prepilin-type N-terminal cleavage/methylation domain-containing protein n=1 Tax=Kineosporia corallincola TaxID=2835133 RepID=A0ABS5TD34_9ACTN|nr:prepilin-type N-terminal cleavage/methylation domain-containing protein [Kineosporia corallincola]MBT0768951.1 prepilin-type N-terminal cleavage/methylation domain-containing protein [Kineosporia corallincola]
MPGRVVKQCPDDHRNDRGLTLVELMVAMGIASVLLVAIGVVFISSTRGVSTLNVKTATTADARITMEAMTRTLRVAFKPAHEAAAFTVADTSELSFYALIYRDATSTTATSTATPDPTLVRYSYDTTSKCVNQTLTTALVDATTKAMSWPTTRARTTCLARTTTAPVFIYYRSGSATASMAGSTGQVATADLPDVASVAITVTAQDPAQPQAGSVPLIDRVTLGNITTSSS